MLPYHYIEAQRATGADSRAILSAAVSRASLMLSLSPKRLLMDCFPALMCCAARGNGIGLTYEIVAMLREKYRP
jgi:hypothetical protein